MNKTGDRIATPLDLVAKTCFTEPKQGPAMIVTNAVCRIDQIKACAPKLFLKYVTCVRIAEPRKEPGLGALTKVR